VYEHTAAEKHDRGRNYQGNQDNSEDSPKSGLWTWFREVGGVGYGICDSAMIPQVDKQMGKTSKNNFFLVDFQNLFDRIPGLCDLLRDSGDVGLVSGLFR
jgi:hypothetical protein